MNRNKIKLNQKEKIIICLIKKKKEMNKNEF